MKQLICLLFGHKWSELPAIPQISMTLEYPVRICFRCGTAEYWHHGRWDWIYL